MKTKDLNHQTQAYYTDRIRQVGTDSKRRWGRMTPAQMLDHVSRTIEASLGDIPIEGNGVLLFKIAKPVVLSGVAPFPPNLLKTPQVFIANGSSTVATEQARLESAINRFLELCESEPERKPKNPLFGPLTMNQWKRLHGLHLNHHLAQFGIPR